MSQEIRVRFAPSPTGYLHVGGARTALFNWLFAKHHGGKFILRIEDTDRQRSTEAAIKAIFQGMEWLGMEWDEGPKIGGAYGPYFQTERLATYKEYIEKLLTTGKAYYCFCTPEELDQQRKEAAERKEAPRYNGKCRKLTDQEIETLLKSGKPYVIRFRLPQEGTTVIHDLVKGDVSFENELLDDFVIMKSDGFPTYNFAAVVDDSLMKITHVIRGEDHISNTPRQILLYEALGLPMPQFGHIPMILGTDRSRLSKRHGATSVIEYRDLGYLPEAMVNYLARLGWSHGDQEIFSREQLIELFSLDRVAKTGAIFDTEKLKWLNSLYIRQSLPERIYDLAMPFLEKAFETYNKLDKEKTGIEYIMKVIQILQDRLVLIADISYLAQYFFDDHIEYDPQAKEKYFTNPKAKEYLERIKAELEKLSGFTKPEIEAAFKGLAKEMGIKLGEIIHPTRLALTGRSESPGIYDVVEILGKEKVTARLQAALETM
ncbi:MAG: glutamate--tRNA ligase [Candidatus Saganbacteria bacterium]|nr:glutamate--tRNA ligase [Candidatus Saganbacteria bacterium]